LIKAISSAFWAEVPVGKGYASMTSSWLTTAYPTFFHPFSTKQLPSVNHLAPGLRSGWSVSSGLLAKVCVITCSQVCSVISSEGSKDAGFKTLQVFIVTSGDSKKMVWYLVSLYLHIHKRIFSSKVALTWWGVRTSIFGLVLSSLLFPLTRQKQLLFSDILANIKLFHLVSLRGRLLNIFLFLILWVNTPTAFLVFYKHDLFPQSILKAYYLVPLWPHVEALLWLQSWVSRYSRTLPFPKMNTVGI
jgi:hypothetical protein